MINAIMLFAGATVFFAGFLLGEKFDFSPPESQKYTGGGIKGDVITNKEYLNFLNYDGTEQN